MDQKTQIFRSPSSVFLVHRQSGEYVTLHDNFIIGRTKGNLTFSGDPGISSRHCRFLYSDKKYILQDLGSSNGTKVNNIKIKSKTLVIGDIIQVGGQTLVFTDIKPEKKATYKIKLPSLEVRPTETRIDQKSFFTDSLLIPFNPARWDIVYVFAFITIFFGHAMVSAYFLRDIIYPEAFHPPQKMLPEFIIKHLLSYYLIFVFYSIIRKAIIDPLLKNKKINLIAHLFYLIAGNAGIRLLLFALFNLIYHNRVMHETNQAQYYCMKSFELERCLQGVAHVNHDELAHKASFNLDLLNHYVAKAPAEIRKLPHLNQNEKKLLEVDVYDMTDKIKELLRQKRLTRIPGVIEDHHKKLRQELRDHLE